jgi:hypothetical protein
MSYFFDLFFLAQGNIDLYLHNRMLALLIPWLKRCHTIPAHGQTHRSTSYVFSSPQGLLPAIISCLERRQCQCLYRYKYSVAEWGDGNSRKALDFELHQATIVEEGHLSDP